VFVVGTTYTVVYVVVVSEVVEVGSTELVSAADSEPDDANGATAAVEYGAIDVSDGDEDVTGASESDDKVGGEYVATGEVDATGASGSDDVGGEYVAAEEDDATGASGSDDVGGEYVAAGEDDVTGEDEATAETELVSVLPVGVSPALTQPVLAVRAAGQVTWTKSTVGLLAPMNQSNRKSHPG
jgi:hypothetical protein